MASQRKRKKNKTNYGLQVVGRIRVWVNEREVKSKGKTYKFTEWVTSLGRKNEDGEYDNVYIPIFFPAGTEDEDKPEHNSIIFITQARLFVTGRGKYAKLSLYIEDWEYDD